ncbi:MAG: oligosaccharide flippase family protein [Bacilli bacterium]
MKKSKFVKSTIILIIGALITKMLSMVIKIVTTRLLGTEGIGIYMLILPTFMLFIALAQLGLPIAISKLVAEDKSNNKNLVFSMIPFMLILNILIIIFLIFSSKYIANNLLHEPRSYYALICIGIVLPLISISNIIRGYFFGKEKMIPHVISNITEDIVRLIVLLIGIPLFITRGLEFAVCFVVLANIASELTSIIVLFFFLPKKFTIEKKDILPNKQNIKNILNISLPTTGSRLIGSIGYFLEPIILTYVLLKIGYTSHFIINQYGIINGYIIPLLLIPSFFTIAISQALIPVISSAYSKNNKKYCFLKIKQAILFSLIIGVPITFMFLTMPQLFLNLIYGSTEGINYLRILAPIFLLYYIQIPLTSALQAINKAKEAMNGTLIGMLFRTSLLLICSFLHIGMGGLIIATSINIIIVTMHQAKHVKKAFI